MIFVVLAIITCGFIIFTTQSWINQKLLVRISKLMYQQLFLNSSTNQIKRKSSHLEKINLVLTYEKLHSLKNKKNNNNNNK